MVGRRFVPKLDVGAAGRMDPVGRRDFLARFLGLGVIGGAMISPGVGRAQQSVPVIGFLHYGSRLRAGALVSALWQGLNEAGFSENRNIAAAYAWGEGHDERLPALALDLLQRGASIIVAGGAPSVAAARRSTETIPIIFVAASAPFGGEFDLKSSRGKYHRRQSGLTGSVGGTISSIA